VKLLPSNRHWTCSIRLVNISQIQPSERLHKVSVVVPVFGGEQTLPDLVEEISKFTNANESPAGHRFQIIELFLVWDCGPDASDDVIRELAKKHPWLRAIWLSRNFGQHAATLAGMASTSGDWIVTLDEDGQHNPQDIGKMLDVAIRTSSQLVYASPTNTPPHGLSRNLASSITKWIYNRLVPSSQRITFHSYRLVLGEIGRAIAAYCGPDVYLDVAFGWVVRRTSYCPVETRNEGRPSSYSTKNLVSHFWRMVISSGTRPLRIVTVTGILTALLGFLLATTLAMRRIFAQIPVQGWTSNAVLALVLGGITIGSLGVIAEYVGSAVKMAMGKPQYLIVRDPQDSPIGSPNIKHG
jgi:glycosyltransferase involved in cell wall biosynthesis